MADTPPPIQNLIDAFSRLPGVGPKTASRLAFYLLNAPDEVSASLSAALIGLKNGIAFCKTCYNITLAGQEECDICTSLKRDAGLICVVEKPLDVLVIDRKSVV